MSLSLCMVLRSVLISFFICSCPVFPAPYIEEVVFAPLYPLASFVKNKVSIGAWVSEKPMAPQSSTLSWKIPWMEEPGGLQSMGSGRIGHDWGTSLSLSCIGEGNGNPLQCSCLENLRDGGAWWATVYRVTQSWTWLKRLSSSSRRFIGEDNGTPLQYSCLENPMDGGAW